MCPGSLEIQDRARSKLPAPQSPRYGAWTVAWHGLRSPDARRGQLPAGAQPMEREDETGRYRGGSAPGI